VTEYQHFIKVMAFNQVIGDNVDGRYPNKRYHHRNPPVKQQVEILTYARGAKRENQAPPIIDGASC
jgi:hypothetical protein